jgi:hypothetical protein
MNEGVVRPGTDTVPAPGPGHSSRQDKELSNMNMRSPAAVAFALAMVASVAAAQTPRGAAVTTLDGKKVTIDYGRPALKGRSLDELLKQLPADRMWRAGENQVSTLTADVDILVGGKKVAAGKYSLYVHAGEQGQWDLVLNRDLGVPLGKIWAQAPENMKNEPWPHLQDYQKNIGDKEVLRAKLTPAKVGQAADLFTMSFAPKGKGTDLTLAWGDEAWSIEVQPAK